MHSLDARELLKTLIALPSVNPMGRDVSGPEFFEGRVSDFLERFFQQLGVPYQRWEVAPGRANLLALHAPAGARRTILLDAHQDTVPVDGMTIEPFTPVERDGRMYGRGACDVKGGMAAMLAAFARLVQEHQPGPNRVVMSCTCDEEATSTGINDLVRHWTEADSRLDLVPDPPDVAVVAEPTDLDIVVAHRGATRWKIVTQGRACHSSEPRNGVNAIYKMGRILAALEAYAEHLRDSIPPHPRCGSATLSVGRIEGGISVNTVPDYCAIEIDRRVIPGENSTGVIPAVADYLVAHAGVDFIFLPPWIESPPLPDDQNGELAAQLLSTVGEVAGPHELQGVPYGTHASRLAAGGIPSVVFGPGSIAQAHTKDEWLDLRQLELATEIYYRFCRSS